MQFLPVSRLEHDGRASLRSSGDGDGANPEATLGQRLRYVGSHVLDPIDATIRRLPAFPLPLVDHSGAWLCTSQTWT